MAEPPYLPEVGDVVCAVKRAGAGLRFELPLGQPFVVARVGHELGQLSPSRCKDNGHWEDADERAPWVVAMSDECTMSVGLFRKLSPEEEAAWRLGG